VQVKVWNNSATRMKVTGTTCSLAAHNMRRMTKNV
jgi:hypothetical protein